MLDVKWVLAHREEAEAALKRRDPKASFDTLITLAEERRAAVSEFGELRGKQKELSSIFGKKGAQLSPDEMAAKRGELKELSARVKVLEARVKELEASLDDAALVYPNLPDPEVPEGTEADNVVLRTWGEPREHAFEAREHDVLGEALGILDFAGAARISGAGFALYKGLGARLERALASFMLDTHTEQHGYTEILSPFLVTRDCMLGTGQLPKFEEDAFATRDDPLFLIPTAEVPVTNLHREQMLDATALPTRYVAYSSCFRREAGSYGRETRGLTRVHQFQKVELVQFTTPEDSAAAHEALTGHAEAILQALGLPYRVVSLATGDLGFSAARCYDLEVWLPGQRMWREISSCSNFHDFQARRANIRYRPEQGAKPRYVHTLNGSGLAIGRTVMALLEQYQRADGGVDLPEALHRYMGTASIEPV